MSKIIACVLTVVIIVSIIIGGLFFGNPVSEYLVKKNAEAYLSENHSGSDYYIDTVNYDFKTGSYYVLVESQSSKDSSFTVYAELGGEIVYDTYESAVTDKWNTAGRINDEYRKAVDEVLTDEDFPYNCHIGFGDIEFCECDIPWDGSVPEYAVSTETLILDKDYDIAELGKKAGHLTIYIYDEEVSAERLSEILLGIRECMDNSGVSFYAINCVLEKENDVTGDGARVEVMDFIYSDIHQRGLLQRVKESDQKSQAYYAQQDKLK